MKRCFKCGETKPLTDFTKASHKKDKLSCWCRLCEKLYRDTYYANNPEKADAKKRNKKRYKLENKEHISKQGKEYYSRTKQRCQDNMLKREYNFSMAEYLILLEQQDYKCAICQILINDYGTMFDVDHDHITGEVRGLLCSRCNMGLGQLWDTIDGAYAGINYLVDPPAQSDCKWPLKGC